MFCSKIVADSRHPRYMCSVFMDCGSRLNYMRSSPCLKKILTFLSVVTTFPVTIGLCVKFGNKK